jgi:hypothetical protein
MERAFGRIFPSLQLIYMPTDSIAKQNSPGEIKKLRAQRHLYRQAKRVAGLQILLTVVIPAIGILCELFWSQTKGSVAFYGIVISIVDVAILETLQSGLRKKAALIQEAFDCSILDLHWDEVGVAARPEEEDIHAASLAHMAGKEDVDLKDWYPAVAEEIPLSLGRIVCQRANLRWDAALRRRYRIWLAVLLLSLGIIVFWVGFRSGFNLEQLTIKILAPIAPMLLWGIREFKKNGEAADTSDRLREKSATLWKNALEGKFKNEELKGYSRQLQTQIYERRITSPMIFDWVYRLLRTTGEEQMIVAATELVQEAKRSLNT